MTPVSGQANVYDMVRADQPQKVGTPLDRNTFRKTQADIRTYPIATGNSVAAGDVVDVVNGEVTRSVVTEANVENAFTTWAVNSLDVTKLNDEYSVVFFTGPGYYALCHLIDNSTRIQVGGQIHIATTGMTNLRIARLNDTKFIATWSDSTNIHSLCGSVTGPAVSLGETQYLVYNGNGFNSQFLVPLSETACAVIYGTSDRIGIHVCTISGTRISRGTDSSLTTHFASSVSATLLPDDSSGNKRVCVCFSDTNDSYKGKAVIATINSSNVVTWGSVVTFNNAASYGISCASNGNTVVVFYNNNSACYCRVLAMNGTSITTGNQIQLESTKFVVQSHVICVGGKFVVCGHGRTSGGAVSGSHAAVLNVSGSDITVNTAYQFKTASATYLHVSPISDSKFIIAYADNGNNNYGTDTILEVNGNQIAGGFTMNSTQAIALESGEAGQEIEVIFAGTTTADFVTEGQAIPSDGVYGYGPAAGWLNVIPYWAKEAGVRIATGSYVGTNRYGASNPNSLTFPFEPKVLFIQSGYYSAIYISENDKMSLTMAYSAGGFRDLSATTTDKTISWYSTEDTGYQLNAVNNTYHFVAIG